MIVQDFCFLAWNPIEIFTGNSLFDGGSTSILLSLPLGSIRNCSYASAVSQIGISAIDKTNGSQVVVVYDPGKEATRVLVRRQAVLHHALNASGTMLCYTVPSGKNGNADAYIMDTEKQSSYLLIRNTINTPDSMIQPVCRIIKNRCFPFLRLRVRSC